MFEKAQKVIAEQMGYGTEKVEEETHLTLDLGADSLDHVEIAMELEEVFDINISDEVAEKIETFGQLVDAVLRIKEEG